MIETKPTHEQARLHLQVYEMRREARLRQGRDWFFKNYHVETIEDAMRIAPPGSENGAFVGMVLWNDTIPSLFHGPTLTLWKTLELLLLASVIWWRGNFPTSSKKAS